MKWLQLYGKTQKLSTSFLLIVYTATKSVQVTRNRWQWKDGRTVHRHIKIDCPKVAYEYCILMRGVDRNDQMTRVRKGICDW